MSFKSMIKDLQRFKYEDLFIKWVVNNSDSFVVLTNPFNRFSLGKLLKSNSEKQIEQHPS